MQKPKTCAVVAGNAPSLKEIDYARLPMDFDVFRCNQFYFEDKYYLGKNVKATLFAPKALFESVYTMLVLKNRGEYNIDSIFIRNLKTLSGKSNQYKITQNIANYFDYDTFIHKMYDGKYSYNIKEFLEWSKLQELYFYKHATTAILLCAIAVSMGYKEIYLAGIDFYEGEAYAFDGVTENILKVIPDFSIKQNTKDANILEWHTKEADLEALAFLAKTYDIRFYCLCPKSPLSRYLPLAPITNNNFIVENKPKDYIKDIQFPEMYAYKKFKAANEYNNEKRLNKEQFRQNIYFRLLKDTLKLPRDIKSFIRYYREKKGNIDEKTNHSRKRT